MEDYAWSPRRRWFGNYSMDRNEETRFVDSLLAATQ